MIERPIRTRIVIHAPLIYDRVARITEEMEAIG
jgi:hypothetical protein